MWRSCVRAAPALPLLACAAARASAAASAPAPSAEENSDTPPPGSSSLYAFGANLHAQLGLGSQHDETRPRRLTSPRDGG